MSQGPLPAVVVPLELERLELDAMLEPLELELLVDPELPETPLELELELIVPLRWSTIVPVVPCGVSVSVVPELETQYESTAPSAVSVSEFAAVV
jgi:hypothetical protein